MVRITEDLVRKKSEHNELLISTLEEVSLHQENIEKIEHIQNWCRDLQILLLQSNLISKIENLFKLKKLEYLNLALNNIEKIENLEKLESLNKLDLTLNFIGELTSLETLRGNYNLRQLILTGNPCTDFSGYRDYVIGTLPQLEVLDSVEITISDRIKAKAKLKAIRGKIVQSETEYKIKRDEQKIRVQIQRAQLEEETENLPEDEKMKRFWGSKSEHCPETRKDIADHHRKAKTATQDSEKESKPKRNLNLFAPCGRPYNLNQAKLEFKLSDEPDRYELDVHIYKYLDTSLIEVDAQPNFVRLTVKGKILQIALQEEISTSNSTSKRSQITGKLLIIMPKLQPKGRFVESLNTGSDTISISDENKNHNLKGTVNYKNIVKTLGKQLSSSSSQSIEQSEIPPLV